MGMTSHPYVDLQELESLFGGAYNEAPTLLASKQRPFFLETRMY